MTEDPRLRAPSLARELLRRERDGPWPACAPEACRAVLERLYGGLETLIGRGGFHALLIRAIALAASEHPSLRRIEARHASAPGLDGLEENLREAEPEDPGAVAIALVTEFLELLVRILGPRLTRSVLRAGWPDATGFRTTETIDGGKDDE